MKVNLASETKSTPTMKNQNTRFNKFFKNILTIAFLFVLTTPNYAQPGIVFSYQKISDDSGSFGGTLPNSALFGQGLAEIGDINCDGVKDLAVGASGMDDGATNSGAIWILFMNTDGTVSSEQKISNANGGISSGTFKQNDYFGNSVDGIGDLNDDGIPDIVVGSSTRDDGGSNRGSVWVLFMKSDGTVNSYQTISDTEGSFTGSLDNNDNFGAAVTSLGDLDGDGIVDIAVGASQDDDGGTNRGAVWVLFLNTDGTVDSYQKISDTAGGFTGTLGNEDRFYAVNRIGDLNGDNIIDIAVGEVLDDDGGTNRGAVWILFMDDDGTVDSTQKISDTEGGFTGTLANDANLGGSITAVGDVNCDGVPDIAAGAWRDDDGGNERGSVFLLFLKSDGTVKSHQQISDTKGSFTGTLNDVDRFGVDVASLGDLDGDNIADLIVGARHDDDGGTDRGAAWVLFSDGCQVTCCSDTASNTTVLIADGPTDTASYLAADIFVWPNGDLIACYNENTTNCDFEPSRIRTKYSTNGGSSWTLVTDPAISETDSALADTGDCATRGVGSPNFLVSADGAKLYMFYIVSSNCFSGTGNNPCNDCPWDVDEDSCSYTYRIFWSEMTIDYDNSFDPVNDTFSTPVQIDSKFGYNIMNNARVIRLSNGTIAMPVSVNYPTYQGTSSNFKCYVIYSTDEGANWDTTDVVVRPTSPTLTRGLMEPEIVEVTHNGVQKIMMVMRTSTDDLYYARIPIDSLYAAPASPEIWEDATALAFPPLGSFPSVAKNTPATIQRLSCSDDLIMIFNKYNSSTNNVPSVCTNSIDAARNTLVSMISTDEGLNWTLEKDLHVGSNKYPGYSYTSITIDQDKLLLTYYEQLTCSKDDEIPSYPSVRLRDKSISLFYDALVADAGSNKYFCDTMTLDGDYTGGAGPVTYSWCPVEDLSNPNIANPLASPSITTVYTLTVTDANGCTATDNRTITESCPKYSGVDENTGSTNNVKIYPNPTRGTVMVQILNVEQVDAQINIYSIQGENLKISQKLVAERQYELDLSDQAEGIYIVRIITSSGVTTKRVSLAR